MALNDVTAPNDLRGQAHDLITTHGLGRAAKLLGINRATLRRIESGAPVQAGSIALARANLTARTQRREALNGAIAARG